MAHAGLVEKVVQFGNLTLKTFVRPESLEDDPEIRAGIATVIPSPYTPSPFAPRRTGSISAASPTTAGSPPSTVPGTLKRKRGRPRKEVSADQPTPPPPKQQARGSNPLKVTGQPLLHLLSEEELVTLNKRQKQGRDFIPSWIGVVKELRRLGRPIPDDELDAIHEQHFGAAARARAEAEAAEKEREGGQQDEAPQQHHQPPPSQQPDYPPGGGHHQQQQVYEPLRPHDDSPQVYGQHQHTPFVPQQSPYPLSIAAFPQPEPVITPGVYIPPQSHPTPPIHISPPNHESVTLPAVSPAPSQTQTSATVTPPINPPTVISEPNPTTTKSTTRIRDNDITTLTISSSEELVTVLRDQIASNIGLLGIPEVTSCRFNLAPSFPFPAPLSSTASTLDSDTFKEATSHLISLVQEADTYSWSVKRVSKPPGIYKRDWSCSQTDTANRSNSGRQKFDCVGAVSVKIKVHKKGPGAGTTEVTLNYRHHAVHDPPGQGTVSTMKTVVGAVVNGGAAGGGAETENSLQRMFEEWGKPKVLKRSRNPAAIAAAAMAAVSADADAAAAAEDAVGGNGNEHG